MNTSVIVCAPAPDAGPADAWLHSRIAAGRGWWRTLAGSPRRAARTVVACVLLALPAPQVAAAQYEREQETVSFRPIEADAIFADAAEPGALQLVCASTAAVLRQHFDTHAIPFEQGLVRSPRGRACHIDYTPSLAGFRAAPDFLPVQELFINVDTLALVSKRGDEVGDALDISARLVKDLPRPIAITLSMDRKLEPHWFALGAAHRYGDGVAGMTWRAARVSSLSNPWTQDFLKSGTVDDGTVEGATRILVPRKLFEGRASDGALFEPMLDTLSDERFARSRLSWEGGDLQFVRDPRSPDRHILFFGKSAKLYWGDDLTDEEYAYVLRREFGADSHVDVSGFAPHTDYFLSFLPADRIILISEPLTGDHDIAEAAARALEEHFGPRAPPVVRELVHVLAQTTTLAAERRRIERLLATARRDAAQGWPRAAVAGLDERIGRHAATYCQGNPAECFTDKGVDTFLRRAPDLLRTWVTEAERARTDGMFETRLLDIIESQILPVDKERTRRFEAKVREIEALGFQVVRVPGYGALPGRDDEWAGVSYANNLLVDDVLFVPTFGLGAAEQRILDQLKATLPARYRIVPTFARHMLLHNGGVHCTVGIVRG